MRICFLPHRPLTPANPRTTIHFYISAEDGPLHSIMMCLPCFNMGMVCMLQSEVSVFHITWGYACVQKRTIVGLFWPLLFKQIHLFILWGVNNVLFIILFMLNLSSTDLYVTIKTRFRNCTTDKCYINKSFYLSLGSKQLLQR